jgi:hypothetical protein
MPQHKPRFILASPGDKHRTDLVTIYHHPEPDAKYTMGLDAATGFGADYTSIKVFSNRMPFEEVAWLRNKRITTVKGSEVANALGRYYNTAFIVPETRHPGNAYVDNLIEVYAYPKLFRRRQTLDEDPSVSSKYGICTTEADKHLLINQTKALMENPDGPQVIFHDGILLNEFCNYVYIEDKRKTGAGEGFFDDTVMAAMLALHGCSLFPQAPREEVEEYNPKEEDRAHQKYLMENDRGRTVEGKERKFVRV